MTQNKNDQVDQFINQFGDEPISDDQAREIIHQYVEQFGTFFLLNEEETDLIRTPQSKYGWQIKKEYAGKIKPSELKKFKDNKTYLLSMPVKSDPTEYFWEVYKEHGLADGGKEMQMAALNYLRLREKSTKIFLNQALKL